MIKTLCYASNLKANTQGIKTPGGTRLKTSAEKIIVNLSEFYGLIAVSGADAAHFLQGQFSSNIQDLSTTRHGFGAYCTPKGRIQALCRIFLQNDIFYLQLPSALLPSILTRLSGVARFSKVHLEDLSATWKIIGLGIRTKEKIESMAMGLPPGWEFMEEGAMQTLKDLWIARLPHPYPRFELLGPIDLINPLWDHLASIAEPSTFDAWKCLDIEAEIPEVWAETTESYLPHTLNLPALGAVSFNKGCYCGQEIIARMEYRGKSKRHLSHILLKNTQTVPAPGTAIYSKTGDLQAEGREAIGTIVTAAYPENAQQVLALIETKIE